MHVLTRTVLTRTLLTMMLALAGVGMAACGEDEPSTLRACEAGGPEKWDSCYDFTDKEMLCTLEVLRGYHAEGRYELEELPDWAITRERNGQPIIFDIRAKEIPFSTTGEAIGALWGWAEERGLPSIKDQTLPCAESLTEGEMREAVGGGEGTTTWDFDEYVHCTRLECSPTTESP